LATSLLADGYSVPSYRWNPTPKATAFPTRPSTAKQIQFKETPDIVPAHPISRIPGLPSPRARTGGPLSRSGSGTRALPPHFPDDNRAGPSRAVTRPRRPPAADRGDNNNPPNLPGAPQEAGGAGEPPDDGSDGSGGGDDRRPNRPRGRWPRRGRDPEDPGDPGDNRGRDHRPRRRGPPGGPDDPGDPHDPDGQGPRRRSPPHAERWQVNHKIPLSSLPEWNGEGKTLIDYLTDLTSYSDLDEMMKSDIAQIAPTRFTLAAKDWFTTLPFEARRVATSSFDEFILCLREHFMDAHWIDERTIEYEEMRF
ncbi:hypothetical protein BDN71DRAFT_1514521, partial [Pleurotus eryngii]